MTASYLGIQELANNLISNTSPWKMVYCWVTVVTLASRTWWPLTWIQSLTSSKSSTVPTKEQEWQKNKLLAGGSEGSICFILRSEWSQKKCPSSSEHVQFYTTLQFWERNLSVDGYAEADHQPNPVCFRGPEDDKVIRDHICNTFFWQFLIFVFLPYAISFAVNLTSHKI